MSLTETSREVESLSAFTRDVSLNERNPAGVEATRIDPLAGGIWDELISTHPDATIFHSSAWARVLARTYGHEPVYFHFSREGKSVALVPLMEVASRLTGRRGVCVPFSDFCAPLLFENWSAQELTQHLQDLAMARKWRYAEWRGDVLGSDTPPESGAPTFYGHRLELCPGEEALFARFHPGVQRAIRKAEKSDVVVRVSQDFEAMREFICLHHQTRKRHGAPPQPRSFFRHIQEEIIARGLGFVALARSGAVCVAASVFFHRADAAVYKFGASDHRYQHLRPNNLMMWNAIRHLRSIGCRSLHLGRTAPDNEGLRRFKLSWGASEELLNYIRFNPKTRLCLSVPPPPSSGYREKAFSKMPAAWNALAGRLIYPHLD